MEDREPSRRNARLLVSSYRAIRRAIGYTGFALPVALGPGGWLLLDIPIQDNLSSYYHTPLRDVFVGTICAIGIFLYCYRGYDRVENWTANLACLSALGIALCPLDPGSDPLRQRTVVGYLHSISGGVFFLTLAFYSLYHFPRSSDEESPVTEDPPVYAAVGRQPQRDLIYRVSGIVILLAMIGMGVYLLFLPDDAKRWADQYNVLFWGEWIAVWAFASAWLTKGRTILSEIAVSVLGLATDQFRDQDQH